jgi:poly(3-hydroxybutyrate) depolymerase
VIVPANLELQLRQWASVLEADTKTPAIDAISGQQRKRFSGPDGAAAIETVLVENMGHAMAVDPDAEPVCGSLAPYFVDADTCAAYWIGRWFGVVPMPDDT